MEVEAAAVALVPAMKPVADGARSESAIEVRVLAEVGIRSPLVWFR